MHLEIKKEVNRLYEILMRNEKQQIEIKYGMVYLFNQLEPVYQDCYDMVFDGLLNKLLESISLNDIKLMSEKRDSNFHYFLSHLVKIKHNQKMNKDLNFLVIDNIHDFISISYGYRETNLMLWACIQALVKLNYRKHIVC